ncbi:MAG: PTS sugar transporter subunit IIB [Arsenophonus sp.]|nr:MAG: PTS sugar transporter subunit IIB [Arsenophonus sp.]
MKSLKNIFRSTLLKQVFPKSINTHVINIKKYVRVYNNVSYSDEEVMMLFTKNIYDVLHIVKGGIK